MPNQRSKYRKLVKAAWRHHSRRLRSDQRGNRVGPELRRLWGGEWKPGRPADEPKETT